MKIEGEGLSFHLAITGYKSVKAATDYLEANT